ncbi:MULTISPECIES: rRNA maturation RNase YbeY [unclassified Roseitalea]|uniref:rRNA maturation RNase YbeY n=1 Tax=unclassified Roseitalea TaxID=2639107 RepID=UPI00273F09EB|nr:MULTISPECIES: rRNA maturation RNase YbeY [unclassified Roseitalea]
MIVPAAGIDRRVATPTPPAVDIAITAPDWPPEAELAALVTSALAATFDRLGADGSESELSVVFADDAAIAALNAQWRGQDKPTNVLSFPVFAVAPGDRLPPMLGDIVLARETIAREAGIDGKSVDAHLTHLIVHGILHLLGYDHVKDSQAEQMERLERVILADLGMDDPYAPVSDS